MDEWSYMYLTRKLRELHESTILWSWIGLLEKVFFFFFLGGRWSGGYSNLFGVLFCVWFPKRVKEETQEWIIVITSSLFSAFFFVRRIKLINYRNRIWFWKLLMWDLQCLTWDEMWGAHFSSTDLTQKNLTAISSERDPPLCTLSFFNVLVIIVHNLYIRFSCVL